MPEVKKGFYTLRTRTKNGYTSVPLDILKADVAVINSTGEEVKITDTTKLVYFYMRNQYCRSLDDSNSKGYYEGWESIASSLGKAKEIFKQGAHQPHKILIKLGLLEVTKAKKGRANLKVVKDVVDIMDSITLFNSKADDYKERRYTERERYLSERSKENKIVEVSIEQDIPYHIPDSTSLWDFNTEDLDSIPF